MHPHLVRVNPNLPSQDSLARIFINMAQGEKVFIAESCTGGQVCASLARIAGASSVWLGGVVVYSNTLKTRLLGVPPDLLAMHGAVSRETALAMVDGACTLYGASLALAITGIAGPSGGSPQKPVGCVFMAIRHANTRRIRQFLFDAGGGRLDIQSHAARAGILALIEELALGAPCGFETMPPATLTNNSLRG